MKRNCHNLSRFKLSVIIIFFASTQLTGCSLISKSRSMFSSDEEKASVPKSQYDQLLVKYEKLLKETRGNSPATEAESPNTEKITLMDDLKKFDPKKEELIETVDVFDKHNASGTTVSSESSGNSSFEYDPKQVEEEIKKLKNATKLISENKFDQSLKMLKELERSKVRQIRVHAKFNVGEILFAQGEYDLSMQLFEEILKQDAFSGLVIKALGRLIVCTEKLKLSKKKGKYFSILHDFFGEA